MLLNLRKLQIHVIKHNLSLQQYKDNHLGKTSASLPSPSPPQIPKPNQPKASAGLTSDRLAEVCRVLCNVCEADVQYDELLRHLRVAHGLATKVGYGEYRFSVHRLHACHMCGRQVMFTRKNVGAHTLKVHQMVFPEYARKYLVDIPLGRDGAPKVAKGNVTDVVSTCIQIPLILVAVIDLFLNGARAAPSLHAHKLKNTCQPLDPKINIFIKLLIPVLFTVPIKFCRAEAVFFWLQLELPQEWWLWVWF